MCVIVLSSFSFLLQNVFFSPGIPPYGRGAKLLFDRLWRGRTYPGVQGEGKAWANVQGEGECFTLACQRLAEIQALGNQGRAFSSLRYLKKIPHPGDTESLDRCGS